MDIRNDYANCLTNLACSVRRYFGLPRRHATLPDVDRLLDEFQPSNVVVFLFDGMGSNLIDKHLADTPNAFLIRHRLRSITSVFPATTVAATTSMLTGLNPCETGMLGWDMWYPGLGKVITTFWDSLPDDNDRVPIPEAAEYRERHMIRPLITDEINEAGQDKAYFVSPFGDTPYETLDEMFALVSERCKEPGRKYVYAYYNERSLLCCDSVISIRYYVCAVPTYCVGFQSKLVVARATMEHSGPVVATRSVPAPTKPPNQAGHRKRKKTNLPTHHPKHKHKPPRHHHKKTSPTNNKNQYNKTRP